MGILGEDQIEEIALANPGGRLPKAAISFFL